MVQLGPATVPLLVVSLATFQHGLAQNCQVRCDASRTSHHWHHRHHSCQQHALGGFRACAGNLRTASRFCLISVATWLTSLCEVYSTCYAERGEPRKAALCKAIVGAAQATAVPCIGLQVPRQHAEAIAKLLGPSLGSACMRRAARAVSSSSSTVGIVVRVMDSG